jgi:hypothetical protein
MQNGKIIKTGSFELAKELENKGYEWLKEWDCKIIELLYRINPKYKAKFL